MEIAPQDWPSAVRRHRNPPGRLVWRRFGSVLVPALLAVGAIAIGAITGAVPVALALEGQQSLKISVQRMSTEAFGTFPSFAQDRTGARQPVLVVDLRRLRVAGLCASTSVPTPLGTYVLRATTPVDKEISAGRFQFALEGVDGLDALGTELAINRDRTAPDGTPVDTSTGGVPLSAGRLVLDVNATARWATVNGLELSGAQVSLGKDQQPCT